ncbi:MAG: acyl-CoA mutase large subunit family protein [Melioribacteraceae bacterium]|nr:acyl-CoA mutase large subunit family protein [Melioribacteraceae bacterium]MCF8356399.1 acyl-CoA mutase large subunit family protein [Melioribacteraceae bacterium]MCF8392259.1 acyl-CoA mutase large subunit family protein [Melioribacteraceae bacterium]MCF8417591.1 acyl-CoA mutase large subunit family protein [Melioribacteraceae bacterium]
MMDEMKNNEAKLDEEFAIRDDFETNDFSKWKEQVEKDLKGAAYEKKLITKTYEGIDLQPIYTRKDTENLKFNDGFPGFDSRKRGQKFSGYVNKSWNICQNLPYQKSEDINEALKNDLSRGQNSIMLTFDTATNLGIDADFADPANVGDTGLSLSEIKTLSNCLKEIDITQYPLFIKSGFSSLPIFPLVLSYLKRISVDPSEIIVSVESDPIGFWISKGELPVKIDSALYEQYLVANYAITNELNFKTIGIDTSIYTDAGASCVQELAFSIATANEYMHSLIGKGLNAESIIKLFRFTYGIGPNYFMEIAKLRAAKILWSKVLEKYGVDESEKEMFIHARTTRMNQTLYDPYVNMLRTTTEAFSAIVGGIDSLQTNPFDETFREPNQFSRRIARNTQIILNEESHLNKLIDPSGGSYYVEKLTEDVAKASWELFKEIESSGGMIESVKNNLPQKLISEVVEKRKNDAAKRKTVIVGTNMYANLSEQSLEKKKSEKDIFYKERLEFLRNYREASNQSKIKEILSRLKESGKTDSNKIIDSAVSAFLEGATIGEITKAIRTNSEGGDKTTPVSEFRLAGMFEELRKISDKIKDTDGERPKVFLANMGPIKQHKARADFAKGFFEVGGFEVISPEGFQSTADAVSAALKLNTSAVVICSTDDTYPEIVPAFVTGIRNNKKEMNLILAGYPKDQIEEHVKSGVGDFIYLGCNAYKVLSDLLTKIGGQS